MGDEVVIGLDPHKASNTIAVLDRDETLLTRRRFPHSDDGLVAMFSAVTVYPKRGCGRSRARTGSAGTSPSDWSRRVRP